MRTPGQGWVAPARRPAQAGLAWCCALLLAAAAPGLAAAAEPLPVLLGLYPHGGASPGYAQRAQELVELDEWLAANGAPAGVSIGGTFISLEDPNPEYNIPYQVEEFWLRGYTPFINIMVQKTAAQVANGSLDAAITAWADGLKDWTDLGGGRRVFLAPLPEMNGDWTAYGRDPANYILAFKRLRAIFTQRGVPASAVSWVFAPNGWAPPGDEFERYYPGDALVDVVGFSAYNFGYCTAQWQEWKTFATIIAPHLARMSAMAPGKPVFLTQTASVSRDPNGFSEALRSQWIADTFSQSAAHPGFRAILWFNRKISQPALVNCLPEVDYRLYRIETDTGAPGLASVMAGGAFGQWLAGDSHWASHAFPWPKPAGLFADVWPAHPLSGRPGPYYQAAAEEMKLAGITNGCGTDPVSQLPTYCPGLAVTRAQMAVFLLRGMRGGGYQPPAATGTVFADVPASYWAAAWVEQLFAEGITNGCQVGPQKYCPEAGITRAQMAVFLLRAQHWPATFHPPAATGTRFADVPASHWAAAWIEELADSGITGGCTASPPAFCPEAEVTRAQMALFLSRTFGF